MSADTTLGWKGLVARGVAAIIFGVFAMIFPAATALALAITWGVYALVDGVGAFFGAFQGGRVGTERILLIMMGVVSVLAGLLAIARPGITVAALVWVLAAWLIVRGAFELAMAFMSEGRTKWMVVFSGALWVIGGIVILIANPLISSGALTLTLGAFAILWGGFSLAAGLDVRNAERAGEISR